MCEVELYRLYWLANNIATTSRKRRQKPETLYYVSIFLFGIQIYFVVDFHIYRTQEVPSLESTLQSAHLHIQTVGHEHFAYDFI